MHFTTNFHGTIVKPIDETIALNKSIFLGLYLNFLRSEGIFEKLAVGGNGGSFAVGYWDNIKIPKVEESFMDKLMGIYHCSSELNPAKFQKALIEQAGIYELNQFLIKSKALMNLLCNDIKANKLMPKEYYENFTE